MAHLGQFQAAIEMERQASLLDPLYAGYHSNQTWYFMLLGHYDEAEREAHKALELQPGFPIVHRNLAVAAIRRNDPVAALQYAGQESDPFWKAYALALALQSVGDHAAADAALQALISTYGAVSPFQITSVYAFRGEADQAFKWLDRAYAEHDGGLTELLEDPFLASLKADRRFAALCRKVGLPAPA